jgi:hypothetical protein
MERVRRFNIAGCKSRIIRRSSFSVRADEHNCEARDLIVAYRASSRLLGLLTGLVTLVSSGHGDD